MKLDERLVPSVPYGWQDVGEYLTIKSRRSSRLNVLGIMNRNNHLETYISSQSINSDVIIACIDAFFPKVDKPTSIAFNTAADSVTGQMKENSLSCIGFNSYFRIVAFILNNFSFKQEVLYLLCLFLAIGSIYFEVRQTN
jgi:hypothetical protein